MNFFPRLVCLLPLIALACDGGGPAPTPASSGFEVADAAIRSGDLAKAAQQLESLKAERGHEVELVQRLGVVYERMDRMADAMVLYKRGLEENPEAGVLWCALGRDYEDLRQFDKAVQALEDARRLGVGDEHVALSLGVCYGQMRDLERADQEFERARAAGLPASDVDYNQALLRMEAGRLREAIDLLESLVKRDPEHWVGQRELGNALLEADAGTPETAERVMALAWTVVDAMPEDWRAYMLLGDAFVAKNDFEAAVEAYTDALRHGENPPIVEDKYRYAKSEYNKLNPPVGQDG